MPDREEAVKALDRLSDDQLHDVVHVLANDPRVKRRKGWRGWWYRYAGSVAFLALVFLGAWGFIRLEGFHVGPIDVVGTTEANEEAIRQINAERAARTDVVASIIHDFCTTNNEQDTLLASLVKVSVDSGATFGKGIDLSQLTDFDIQVLTSIAKVQQLSEDTDTHLTRLFERKLKSLQNTTDCEAKVASFLNAG